MKKIAFLLVFLWVLFGCKNRQQPAVVSENQENILHQIAYANGFENWDKVEEIRYTFNVDRDTSHYERSWIWWPQENKVVFIGESDTLTYLRSQMDSLARQTDKAFINDKYWLLFPFNLVWDKGFDHTVKENTLSPISQKPMTEVTISYNQTDGYTPGDTYKIYVEENFMIREWSYFPDGQQEPAMHTTWENYQTFSGIKIATMHRNKKGNLKLYFDGVLVE